mgnify:CR=1 FL=1
MGVKQAHHLRELLRSENFEKIYTSQLRRAQRTAEIISAGWNIPIQIDPRLNEIDQGEWTGKSGRELFKTEELYRKWVANPFEAHPPNGETFLQVVERARSFLQSVEEKRVLVVAHGGLLAVMRALAEKIPLERAWALIPKNAELIRISFNSKG